MLGHERRTKPLTRLTPRPVCAIDDETAIRVVDGAVGVVSKVIGIWSTRNAKPVSAATHLVGIGSLQVPT
jgi:hypothetical protein